MISRYTLPEMGRVWSESHKYELWCKVETLALEAQAEAGLVPADAVAPVRAAPPPTPEAVAEIEAVTHHDVIAFLTAWADNTEPREAAADVHLESTSSDLLDTALALALTEATDLLIGRAIALTAALREHALEHRDSLRPGRSHGIHAEPNVGGTGSPTSRSRWRDVLDGCVGPGRRWRSANCPARSARIRASTRRSRRPCSLGSGCTPAEVSTQVVLRDGIAESGQLLAIVATICEAVALEVRHGQRTEVAELAEAFGSGQKGSSSMPHKRNPVRSERIAGLARVVRAQVVPVLRAFRCGTSMISTARPSGWRCLTRRSPPTAPAGRDHEPDHRAGRRQGQEAANLDATHGLIYSSAVLLELVESGMSRKILLRAGAAGGDGDLAVGRTRSVRDAVRARPPPRWPAAR